MGPLLKNVAPTIGVIVKIRVGVGVVAGVEHKIRVGAQSRSYCWRCSKLLIDHEA